MKAIIFENYGAPEVLQYVDLPKPEPASDEVLVKIYAAALNAADWHIMRGKPYFMRLTFGIRKPKYNRFGCDMAGVVEAVGANVTEFKPGDEVFGEVSGDFKGFGACSEYLVLKEDRLVHKPKNLTLEEAAAVPLAAISAYQGLKKGRLKPSEHILINGASGGVGTYAVQLAKAFGAHVTAVCSSSKVEMVKKLGADVVIDYTQVDFISAHERYDMVFAVNGSRALREYRKILKPQGRYVMCGGENRQLFEVMIAGKFYSSKDGQQFAPVIAKYAKSDLIELKQLIEEGKVRPVIDKVFSLKDTNKAMAYLEEGHARGKIVIQVGS
ncbi:MAG: alcohol dehydrogenase [Flammeovirgaceae bacterium]|nr:alcohol dehydrogenase [Flammeovirgaceae bacterium]HCX22938.1 alcohol dehydrogenase [Cytophagales bacterium]|tara:strand:- start:101 stop:1078 length:978 start_codon:yes stop_codon:yes gene_type:complete